MVAGESGSAATLAPSSTAKTPYGGRAGHAKTGRSWRRRNTPGARLAHPDNQHPRLLSHPPTQARRSSGVHLSYLQLDHSLLGTPSSNTMRIAQTGFQERLVVPWYTTTSFVNTAVRILVQPARRLCLYYLARRVFTSNKGGDSPLKASSTMPSLVQRHAQCCDIRRTCLAGLIGDSDLSHGHGCDNDPGSSLKVAGPLPSRLGTSAIAYETRSTVIFLKAQATERHNTLSGRVGDDLSESESRSHPTYWISSQPYWLTLTSNVLFSNMTHNDLPFQTLRVVQTRVEYVATACWLPTEVLSTRTLITLHTDTSNDRSRYQGCSGVTAPLLHFYAANFSLTYWIASNTRQAVTWVKPVRAGHATITVDGHVTITVDNFAVTVATASVQTALSNQANYSPPNWANRIRFPEESLPDFSQVGIVLDYATGRRFSRGSPVSPALVFRRCSVLTSLHPYRISISSLHLSTASASAQFTLTAHGRAHSGQGGCENNGSSGPLSCRTPTPAPHEGCTLHLVQEGSTAATALRNPHRRPRRHTPRPTATRRGGSLKLTHIYICRSPCHTSSTSQSNVSPP
ncbi:hypothetical protein PR048_029013 [Dryococelus australis]|uniref:Uncharacterized protein n=1 Tax=Dryococelus australis TaxID=614101 RepID=A0ABQ9GCR8_9NEOP|nr:hypothetical protein PR048_029013 [Dryococelus australis]